MDILVSFEDGSSAYLSHHGVKGMHWGVWNSDTRARYSGTGSERSVWRGSKRAARQMNRLDKERAILVGRRQQAETGVYNSKRALKKAKLKGNTKRVQKLAERNEKYNSDLKKYDARRSEIQKEYVSLGKQIMKNGHELRITNTTRSTLSKGEKAANIGLVALQYMTPTPIVIYSNPRTSGQKFKAQKERKKIRTNQFYANTNDFK